MSDAQEKHRERLAEMQRAEGKIPDSKWIERHSSQLSERIDREHSENRHRSKPSRERPQQLERSCTVVRKDGERIKVDPRTKEPL